MANHQLHIAGESLSFKQLFRDFYPSLVHFAYTILNNRHDAEDVVQDVFMNIWRHQPVFEHMLAFKAYVYTSTRNKALDTLRKKSPVYQDMSLIDTLEHHKDSLIKEEAFRLLDASINQLPERSRQIISLSVKGLSIKEVAIQLNITINTVKTLKLRAYRFLKTHCAEAWSRSY